MFHCLVTIAHLLTGFASAGPYEDGVAALRAGQAAQAETLLASATSADPTHASAWWELGFARYAQREWADAGAAWTRVAALEPGRKDLGFWQNAARERARLATLPLPAAPISRDKAGPTVTFAAAGDTMMGSDLKKGAAGIPDGDGKDLFAPVAPILRSADVAFVNLEGPLADGLPSTKCRPDSTSCYAFRTPTRYVAALTNAGFDVAQLANNHAWDLGVPGQEATMKALDAAGIVHAGRWGDVGRIERDGVIIGVVAAHFGECCLNINQVEEIQRAIGEVDAWADIVVFGFHGGAEGAGARHVTGKPEVAFGEQRGDEKKLSRAAVDAGADLVIGTGPHVLRAMEVYQGRLIAYSLGNFMGFRQFGTQGGFGGTTVIVEAELAKSGELVSARLHPIALDGESIPRPDPAGLGLEHIRELTAADFPDTGVTVAPDGRLSWK